MTTSLGASALLPWLISVAAALGLVIGSFLNVLIWQVSRGEATSTDRSCPVCDAAIRLWGNVPVVSRLNLRCRCSHCHALVNVRYRVVELGTATAFALVTWWAIKGEGWSTSLGGGSSALDIAAHDTATLIAWWITLVAYLAFVSVSVSLTLIDLHHERLPDLIVLPSLIGISALLVLVSVITADWARLIATIGGASALFGLYFAIALVHPQGIGMGDVKLAPLIGGLLGFIGWGSFIVGVFAGFALGAFIGLGLIAVRRASRKSSFPFGPCMLLGAWIGILWGGSISEMYI